jgi:hypothetical protein
MPLDNAPDKPPRRWARWLGFVLLGTVPAVALGFLSPNHLVSGGEADLAAVRDGISGDFLVLDAPGAAHTVQAPLGGTQGEVRLNSWTPTANNGNHGNGGMNGNNGKSGGSKGD